MKNWRVHIGHTRNGRNRWRYFPTIEAATVFCSVKAAMDARKARNVRRASHDHTP